MWRRWPNCLNREPESQSHFCFVLTARTMRNNSHNHDRKKWGYLKGLCLLTYFTAACTSDISVCVACLCMYWVSVFRTADSFVRNTAIYSFPEYSSHYDNMKTTDACLLIKLERFSQYKDIVFLLQKWYK